MHPSMIVIMAVWDEFDRDLDIEGLSERSDFAAAALAPILSLGINKGIGFFLIRLIAVLWFDFAVLLLFEVREEVLSSSRFSVSPILTLL